MNITLKDGSVKTVEAGITAADVAKELSMGLYKAACVCEVNGEICDLRTPLTEDCTLSILTFDDAEGKKLSGTLHPTSSHRQSNVYSRLQNSQSARQSRAVFTTTSTSKNRFLRTIL